MMKNSTNEDKYMKAKTIKQVMTRVLPSIILATVIVVVMIVTQWSIQLNHFTTNEVVDTLENSLISESYRLDFKKWLSDIGDNTLNYFNQLYAFEVAKDLGIEGADESYLIESWSDKLSLRSIGSDDEMREFSVYVIDGKGNVLNHSLDVNKVNLPTLEETDDIIEAIRDNQRKYGIYPYGDGYVVLCRNFVFSTGLEAWEYTPTSLGEIVFEITPTGETITLDESIWGRFSRKDVQKMYANREAGFLLSDLEGENEGFYYLVNEDESGRTLVAGIDFEQLLSKSAKSVLVTTALYILVGIVLSVYAIKMGRPHQQGNSRIDVKRVAGKLRFNRALFNHMIALLVVCFLFTSFTTAYVQTLLFMSEFSIEAAQDVRNIEEIAAKTNDIRKEMEQIETAEYAEAAFVIAHDLKNCGGEVTSEYLAEIVTRNNVLLDEISLFDNWGTLQLDNAGSSSYRMEYTEGHPETECLKLLTNGEESIVTQSVDQKDGSVSYFAAVRRTDKPGLIRIHFKTLLRELHNSTINNMLIITLAETGCGDKYYILKNDPDSVYKTEGVLKNNLPEEVLQDGYVGFRYLDGTLRYISVRNSDGYILICAKNVPVYLQVNILGFIIICAVGYLLLTAGLILLNGFFVAGEEELADREVEHENLFSQAFSKEKQLNRQFSRTIKLMITATGVILLGLMILDWAVNGTKSQVSFLFGRQWKYGFNMFSLTIVILTFIAEQLVAILSANVIILIANNTGRKGKTIGKMLASLVRMALLILTLFFAMVEFGVNLTSLLAGAGIVGAAISFCAQSTVSDLISGLFMIFEGKIRVGDWVLVEDLKGEVVEIGIRTTVLAKSGCLFVINNSKMSNVTVLDKDNSGPVVEFSVGYSENVEEVIKLIESNGALYMSEIPYIKSAPRVVGITELGDHGVGLKMFAEASEANTRRAEFGMLRVTKKLFDQYGVEIPWPQIVVHPSEPVIHSETKKYEQKDSEDDEDEISM